LAKTKAQHMKRLLFLIFAMFLLIPSAITQETGELAAVLEVLAGDVEIQRVNTVNRLPVSVEAVVGVGDTIYTGADGRARITYFEDGVSTEILPDTTYRIDRFEGDVAGDTFNLEVSVLLGRTAQQLQRLLSPNASYDINTPSMTLAARGTAFEVRVEDTGRAGMIVSEGLVDANADAQNADVPAGFGVRSVVEDASAQGLSDVVRATTFEELDAALDGCTIGITTPDDVSLNVRNSPTTEAELVGYLTADSISTAIGTNASGDWYRVTFEDSFGWVLASSAQVGDTCAGLRVFPDDYTEGDMLTPDVAPADTNDASDDASSTDDDA
jgi:hypothetical protein